MVALEFFNKSVTSATKRKIAHSLEKAEKKFPLKYTKFDFNVSELRELDEFVSKKTVQF